MSTVRSQLPAATADYELLQSGDRMSQREFHRLYKQTPRKFKAELIGGMVFVASPLRSGHGDRHVLLGSLLVLYQGDTAGVKASDNATVVLGDDSEPQPDLHLRVKPEHGGRTSLTPDDYVKGPPEFVAEVAYSSRAIDLHLKRQDYTRNGVYEYVVWIVEEDAFRWFDLRAGREEMIPADGIIRSVVFPGLWIDTRALAAADVRRAVRTLEQGLDSPEHRAYVAELESRAPRAS